MTIKRKQYTFSSEIRDFFCPLIQLRHNVAWLNVSMSSLAEKTYELHFQVQHRCVKKETMLELPKRDLKELPGWAMYVLRVLHRAGIRS